MSRPDAAANSEQTPMRASDAERAQIARVLQQQFMAGRLGLAEFDERTRAAYAARTRAQLDDLTEDLPEPAPLPTARPQPRHGIGATAGSWAGVRPRHCLRLGARSAADPGDRPTRRSPSSPTKYRPEPTHFRTP
ncbi:MAG: DUF1707 SHOCT-like domain-containing protein [Sciscionella sp.]